MVNRTSENENLALGRHYALFEDAWPQTISLMASRKWSNIQVSDLHYEVQSSLFSDDLSDIDHLTVSVLIANFNPDEFEEWLAGLCTKLVEGTLDRVWLNEQKFVKQLSDQLQMKIKVVWTLPSDKPGPADHSSLHVGVVICAK